MTETATATEAVIADEQAPLEAVIKGEVLRMYQEVAEKPNGEFHFYHGREAAEMFGYDSEWLDKAPEGAVASFAGVGNPHARSELKPGETVLDLGSGAGLDSIIASWQVGPSGKVIGVDLNPTMCIKAQAHAKATGTTMECHEGRMEDLPLPDGSIDAILSNGVINLSFRKRRVIEEMFRTLKPGGRFSITDIVSAKQLSQSIVNDPKLWASWIGGALLEGEMFNLLEAAGFKRVRSAVVSGFQFRKGATQDAAESFGVKAVHFTASKPAPV
jgi:arsenite methyltransferase